MSHLFQGSQVCRDQWGGGPGCGGGTSTWSDARKPRSGSRCRGVDALRVQVQMCKTSKMELWYTCADDVSGNSTLNTASSTFAAFVARWP